MNYFINQRVKEFIESREIKPVDFAKEIGLNSDRVSKWFRMKEKIPAEHVIIIIEKYKDIDARWLLTGETAAPAKAKPYYKPDVEIDIANDVKECCRLCKEKDERIIELKDHITTLKSQIEAKKEIPDADSTQLGEGAKHGKTG
jgi:transcriptional regulator with XRE-family HTH domain